MGQNEDRQKILQMLAKGTITVEEADQLLSAMNLVGADEGAAGDAREASPAAGAPKREAKVISPKWLRVVVEPKAGREGDKVNVRVPFQLLRAGAKLAAFIPKEARLQVEGKLQDHGMNIDLSQLTPESLDELIGHLGEMSIDVDNDKETVRVFCE